MDSVKWMMLRGRKNFVLLGERCDDGIGDGGGVKEDGEGRKKKE